MGQTVSVRKRSGNENNPDYLLYNGAFAESQPNTVVL